VAELESVAAAVENGPPPAGRPRARSFAVQIAIGLLVFIWGTTWAAIRIGLRGMPPFTGVAIRFLAGTLLLLALLPVFRVRLGRHRREPAIWLANGILLFTVSYGVVYWSEQWMPSGLAAVLFATFPIFVALMAHFLVPGERLHASAVGGALLGFAGVAILYSQDLEKLGGPRMAGASLLFLLSPVASALANVLVKRWGKGVHPLSTTVVPMAIGAVLLGAIALARERHMSMRFDAASIGSIAYLVVFGTATTFLLYFWLLSRLPARKLALITYGTPVVAVCIGTAFLHEPLTARMVAGSAVVVAGVALAVRSH
jgi:drug/metabolite transporter (DMT)-like permease